MIDKCYVCQNDFNTTEFFRRKDSKLGYKRICKQCINKRAREYYKKNPNNKLVKNKEWILKNREKHRKLVNNWYTKNKSKRQEFFMRNPEKRRDNGLNKYGITHSDFLTILESQDFRCVICRKHQDESKKIFCVDHRHINGNIRGILCNKCNSLLGYSGDNISILENAIRYLRAAKE
jgi:hypothetical protein